MYKPKTTFHLILWASLLGLNFVELGQPIKSGNGENELAQFHVIQFQAVPLNELLNLTG